MSSRLLLPPSSHASCVDCGHRSPPNLQRRKVQNSVSRMEKAGAVQPLNCGPTPGAGPFELPLTCLSRLHDCKAFCLHHEETRLTKGPSLDMIPMAGATAAHIGRSGNATTVGSSRFGPAPIDGEDWHIEFSPPFKKSRHVGLCFVIGR
ncbi:hypothetical protein HRR81_007507 [Exophiala dermatitidis]|uniref:Uncharacterized protein n=2 Tax=Exophiala dermatitidis TaxID=5970 RepID=H6BLP5_EXODN|nr:uncharacterized protein HMPREF1120_01090 [Exophiala dermatitidis NIH/UT8656]KAJ4521699.1 hypothetical protein HRR73_002897 [Exophiala dermatitidis]EHY52884.1 hypothetical protein HMPREF1120_01090 [Exophiala dermatitidis NIH/UT8656]KAJ4539389.1 hypothetical protein HRR77_006277 [Exophiala dermatitidis]KAJ4562810.1 hypothetical protein HRR79_006410 [Exophiala dermatitidis]KAJ4565840.1 hypothetical protein HRR81_007507 [Exophiala dermatitidis]